MGLKEIAEQANIIEDEIGLDIDDVLNKLTQELGEFNDATQKYRGRYCRESELTTEHIKEEVGDLVFNLISVLNRLKINPDEIPYFAENTLNKFKERKDLYKKYKK